MLNKMLSSSTPDESVPLISGPPLRRRENRSFMGSCFILIAGILVLFYMYRLLIGYQSDVTCSSPKYDYDILAIRWTPSFCSTRKCINLTENWEIHGLWPSWSNGSEGPEDCCSKPTFFETELKTILPQLSVDWPNQIPTKDQDSLWNHEWSKHGTCSTLSRSKNGLLNYFNTTLALFHRYPIQSWLNEAKIKPTPIDQKFAYTLDEIHEAIESKTNSTISIHCTKLGAKIKLLDTIYLCFKSPSMELISCPADRCYSAKKVILPQK
ncbi:ribonuclease Oy-like [Panonychus citri]|uniref:ribonuclease Oy-like n=1 Tax=Panonychus citri TaxID=50023 RepID=UPI0023082707|nr:ribonuclease Oy-like [Panonychus citri]